MWSIKFKATGRGAQRSGTELDSLKKNKTQNNVVVKFTQADECQLLRTMQAQMFNIYYSWYYSTDIYVCVSRSVVSNSLQFQGL